MKRMVIVIFTIVLCFTKSLVISAEDIESENDPKPTPVTQGEYATPGIDHNSNLNGNDKSVYDHLQEVYENSTEITKENDYNNTNEIIENTFYEDLPNISDKHIFKINESVSKFIDNLFLMKWQNSETIKNKWILKLVNNKIKIWIKTYDTYF